MLEAVLDDGLQEHGWDSVVGVGYLHIEGEVGLTLHADALEVDVVLDVLHFLGERHGVGATVVDDVAQHLGELEHRGGGFLVLHYGEGIDAVEGIEEEVGVDLCTQVLELLLHLLFVEHSCLPLAFVDEVVDGGGGDDDEQEEDELEVEDGERACPSASVGIGCGGIGCIGEVHVDVGIEARRQGHEDDEHEEDAEVEERLAAMEQLGQEEVLHDGAAEHHGKDGGGGVAEGFHPSEGAHEEQDHGEIDQQPQHGIVVLSEEEQQTVADGCLFGLHRGSKLWFLSCAKIAVRDEICKRNGRNKCYKSLNRAVDDDFSEYYMGFGELYLFIYNIMCTFAELNFMF